MAKGDKIRVMLDAGNGVSENREYVADKAGRNVTWSRNARENMVEIVVTGRAGTPARTVFLRLDKVILIEEIPA